MTPEERARAIADRSPMLTLSGLEGSIAAAIREAEAAAAAKEREACARVAEARILASHAAAEVPEFFLTGQQIASLVRARKE